MKTTNDTRTDRVEGGMMSSDQAVTSVRVAEAQNRAEERLRQQRDLLRPLGWAVIAVVVAGVLTQATRARPRRHWHRDHRRDGRVRRRHRGHNQ